MGIACPTAAFYALVLASSVMANYTFAQCRIVSLETLCVDVNAATNSGVSVVVNRGVNNITIGGVTINNNQQPSVAPRANYNPSNGEIIFTNVYPFVSNSIHDPLLQLRIQSRHENLLPQYAVGLSATNQTITERFSNITLIGWNLNNLDDSFTRPLSGGNVIVPNTDIKELSFLYFTSENLARFGKIHTVPEPSRAALLLMCCVLPVVAYRRR